MPKFTLNNPKQLALNSIAERLKIEFKDVPFSYSNSSFHSFDDENPLISSEGSNIVVTISESQPEINEIQKFLINLLTPNYTRVLLEFANHFKAIEGATVVCVFQ